MVNLQSKHNLILPGTNLFITNLSKTVDIRDIEKLYEKYGRVVKSKLVKDQYTGYNVSIPFYALDRSNLVSKYSVFVG